MTQLPNWFESDGRKNFADFLITEEFAGSKVRCLQIGAYSGDASVWLATNVLKQEGSVLVDVDTWEGSDEPSHHGMNWSSVEQTYDAKTFVHRSNRKIIKFKGTSDWFFKNNVETYDFIYVDGDHTAYGVLKDAISSYECLNVGGIIAFDDYQWSAGLGQLKEPKIGINSFLSVFGDRIEVLLLDYQCWVRKVA